MAAPAPAWWEQQDNLAAIRDHVLQSGLLMKASEGDDKCIMAPVTVMPSRFPEDLFEHACSIQQDLNALMVAMSDDHEFLTTALESVLETDDFTRRVFEVYEAAQADNRQTCTLGIFRSDYMLDKDPTSSQLQLRQIEMNMIACAYWCLSPRLEDVHKHFTSQYCPSESFKLLPNVCLQCCVDAFACAWRQYEDNQRSCVLIVVSPAETNIFDHRPLEAELWKRITVIRRTLTELAKEASLGPNKELLVAGQEVAVVYYRAGYDPSHYPSDKEWSVRVLMECSRASLCPTAAQQLVGTKKIQQVLAGPGVLEKYLSDPAGVGRIRSTFAGLYSLDLTDEGDKAVKMALESPHSFVLKPQREGGGHNYYDDSLCEQLQKLGRSQEREAFILMDRVRPPAQQNFIVRHETTQLKPVPTVSELGVFGVYLRKGDKVILNSEGGHLLRTKPFGTDEGGVALGAASLDSPALVPLQEFLQCLLPVKKIT